MGLPVANCLSFPLDSEHSEQDSKQKVQKVSDKVDKLDEESESKTDKVDEGSMGWVAKRYLLVLQTPEHAQSLAVCLDSMFLSAIMRSKETKSPLSLNGYPSKIVCTPSSSTQIASLCPDMILIPNQHDVHAFLFST